MPVGSQYQVRSMAGRYGRAACVETSRLPTHRRDVGVSRSSPSRDLSSGTRVVAPLLRDEGRKQGDDRSEPPTLLRAMSRDDRDTQAVA